MNSLFQPAATAAEPPARGAHEPNRDTYGCLACRMPWPCTSAIAHLTATLTPAELATRMWDEFDQAIPVLRGLEPTLIFRRFRAWPA